jgi:glycosyltransferase involved in cell wall biosynthesis
MQFVSRLPGFHIFASNRDTRNKLKGWISEKLWKSTPVTYTCVDRLGVEAVEKEAIDPFELRRRFNIPENKFVVLTVGQFIDRKGRWVLLEAAKKAVDLDKDLFFLWLTPSLPNETDAERVNSYHLEGQFRLLRSASVGKERLDILRFFKVADCLVLPSFVEGLPIAILEAMALGLPTISTNVFAVPEAIRHEETGLLVEPGDADALCGSILKLKNDRELSQQLSRRGRRLVLDQFDERDASRIAIRAFEECFETA